MYHQWIWKAKLGVVLHSMDKLLYFIFFYFTCMSAIFGISLSVQVRRNRIRAILFEIPRKTDREKYVGVVSGCFTRTFVDALHILLVYWAQLPFLHLRISNGVALRNYFRQCLIVEIFLIPDRGELLKSINLIIVWRWNHYLMYWFK